MIITIDGPAGAGKSSVARQLAAQLGYRYLDSGATYRAVAYATLRAGADPGDADAVARIVQGLTLDVVADPDAFRILLTHPELGLAGATLADELRTADVAAAASRVAAQGVVRSALVERQRAICATGDWVVEGRDMGTAVFPESRCKIYLDADPTVRAARRAGEGSAETAADIAARDARDTGRTLDPLQAAADAVVIDTTDLGLAEVLGQCVALAARARDASPGTEPTE